MAKRNPSPIPKRELEHRHVSKNSGYWCKDIYKCICGFSTRDSNKFLIHRGVISIARGDFSNDEIQK